jgi:hypothetical protein
VYTPEGLETALIEMSDKDLDLRHFLPGLAEGKFQLRGSVVALPVVVRALHLKSPIGHIHDVLPLVSVCHACVAKADLIRDRVARLQKWKWKLGAALLGGRSHVQSKRIGFVSTSRDASRLYLPAGPRESIAAVAP